MEKKSESVFDAMPSKFAFWAGFVAAIAVFSLVGLLVLGSVLLDDEDGTTTKKSGVDTAAVADAGDTGTAEAAAAAAAAVPDETIDLESLTHVRGEGDLTLVEFSDFECPFCQRFHPTVQQAMDAYDGELKWAYKHFPLTNIHPYAQGAAEAAECAGAQGKFWEYSDALFATTDTLNSDTLEAIADEQGLDRGDFDTCVSEKTYTDVVSSDAALGQKLGGTGTPYSVLVDSDGNVVDVISGAQPYENVAAIIERNL